MSCRNIFQDWQYNPHDFRIRVVLVFFRLAQLLGRQPRLIRGLASPYFILYRIIVFWIFHMELHWTLSVGEGLRIFHGYCLVIHPCSRIGRHVTLRHCVTLGNKRHTREAPVLMDNVEIGAHTVIIGSVIIGPNAIVGAGSVVTKDVPSGSVVAGNPAKVLASEVLDPTTHSAR
jgi:putative colanic acid biosynthesis acetyltransferase WcaB